MSTLRIPPHSEEAERAILGSILLDPVESIYKTMDAGIGEQHFYDRRHQCLFAKLLEMDARHVAMDGVTISEYLKERGFIDKVGGYDYLIQLQDYAIVPAHVTHYCGIVAENKKRRDIIEKASDAIDRAYKSDEASHDIAEDVIRGAECITLAHDANERSTRDVANEAYRIDEAIAHGDRFGLPFPWCQFQRNTHGIPPKMLAPIFGRDGKGKSWLAKFLTHFWINMNIPVLYFPFEDGREILMSHLAALHGRYDRFSIFEYEVAEDFLSEHAQTLEIVSGFPIYHKDEPMTVERMVSEIAKHKRKYGIEGVVIDGFKDIILSKGETQTIRENHVCAELVRACKKYDVTIIPIMHLTKIEEDRWIYPMHMKGSGTLHQSARFVMAFQDSGFPNWMKNEYNHELTGKVVLEAEKVTHGTNDYVVLTPEYGSGGFAEFTRQLVRETEEETVFI